MCNTNIIAIKYIIFLLKKREKQKLSKSFADIIILAMVASVLSSIDFAWRFKLVKSNADKDVAKKLGLIKIKKYWKHTSYVEIELDLLHYKILKSVLSIKNTWRIYDIKKVSQNISVRQEINSKLVSFFLLPTIYDYLVLRNRKKRYFQWSQVGKKIYTIFVKVRHKWLASTKLYINRRKQFKNKKKSYNKKYIERLLLTVTMVDIK